MSLSLKKAAFSQILLHIHCGGLFHVDLYYINENKVVDENKLTSLIYGAYSDKCVAQFALLVFSCEF